MQLFISVLLFKVLGDSQAADDTVLVKTIAPIGATIVGAIGTCQIVDSVLHVGLPRVESRVRVLDVTNDLVRVDMVSAVERDTECSGSFNALQQVHVVREGCRFTSLFVDVVIPSRPCFFASR